MSFHNWLKSPCTLNPSYIFIEIKVTKYIVWSLFLNQRKRRNIIRKASVESIRLTWLLVAEHHHQKNDILVVTAIFHQQEWEHFIRTHNCSGSLALQSEQEYEHIIIQSTAFVILQEKKRQENVEVIVESLRVGHSTCHWTHQNHEQKGVRIFRVVVITEHYNVGHKLLNRNGSLSSHCLINP